MTAYYNEFDAGKTEWLRELMKRGLIAQGEVDERSIVDVRGDDLRGFSQCHFFAGVGGWSYALRLAGWSDERAIWTASCPCQPYSISGKKKGAADKRNLWPELARLVRECPPRILIGEQVSSPYAMPWFDTVCDDLESEAYTCWAADLCAASVGAPGIRQRLYWAGVRIGVADPLRDGAHKGPGWDSPDVGAAFREGRRLHDQSGDSGNTGGMADASIIGCHGRRPGEEIRRTLEPQRLRDTGWLADTPSAGREIRGDGRGTVHAQQPAAERGSVTRGMEHSEGSRLTRGRIPVQPGKQGERDYLTAGRTGEAGSGSFWGRPDWALTRPARMGDCPSLRPVRPAAQRMADGLSGGVVRGCRGGFPLAEKAEARTLALRGFGDAIVPQLAAMWIKTVEAEL